MTAAAAVRAALLFGRTAAGLLAAAPSARRATAGGGFAGWVRGGRTGFVLGGPVGGGAAAVIAAVGADCAAAGVSPLWLNVTADELPTFRAAGFGPTKTAEECVVRHPDRPPGEWPGGRFRSVRRAVIRSRRAGVTVREEPAGANADELLALAERHAAAKPQRGLPWWLDPPPPCEPRDPRRLWVARCGGTSVAAVTAHPLGVREADGSRRWTLATFHRDPLAPPGTATAAVAAVIDALAAEGVAAVSLGPAPALRCGMKTAADRPVVRRAAALWFQAGNGLFDARGLWHFKSRFRPDLEPLFACGTPTVSVRQAAGFVLASGVLRADPRAVVWQAWRDLRRPRAFGAPP